MLHRHVVALFDHGVLVINIAAGAHHGLRAAGVVETKLTLRLEALFAGVEHHCVLQVLVARLVERARPVEALGLLVVLARPRDIELKTLAVMGLVEMEPWGGGIEANFFANDLFIVRRSCLLLPFTIRVAGVAQTSDLVFDSKRLLILHYHLSVLSLGHNLLARVATAGQEAHVWIGSGIGQVKAVGRRIENTVWLPAFLGNRGLNAGFGL